MNSTNKKSVVIEGDRAMFATKGAVDRFKRDIRVNDEEKLKTNDYFREGWTYKVVSSDDNEIKVKLVNVQDEAGKPRVLECDERRKMLKEKLRLMRQQKMSPAQLKMSMKDKVPTDVLDAYMTLRKFNVKIPIPPPNEVLGKPAEYRNVVHTMIQSFGMVKGNNNPVVNYFKLLAQHLGLPTEFVAPQNNSNLRQTPQSNAFIDELRKQRNDLMTQDVDDEMRKIYESLGIESTEETKPSEEEEMDDEMKKIYESLGMSVNKNMEV